MKTNRKNTLNQSKAKLLNAWTSRLKRAQYNENYT